MAIVAAGALVLSGCTSGGDDDSADGGDNGGTAGGEENGDGGDDGGDETDGGDGGGEYEGTDKEDLGDIETQDEDVYFSVGADEWTGYNGVTAQTYSVYNSVINGRMHSGFWYYGTDGTIYPNEEFGSYEQTSEEPLVVEYTISDEAQWSDGNAIDYADVLLDWVSQNPEATTENPDEPLFNHVSTSFGDYVPEGPQGEIGGKEFTLEYSEPYPDWRLLVGSFLPAHVVAEQIGISEDELAQAILDRDMEVLADAAEFWNNGWLADQPGQVPDAAIVPSSGPWGLDGATWESGQSLTLVPNEEYWGTPPGIARMTFRFTAPEAHVQALENGDLNVIEPQATVDTLTQLEGLGDQVTVDTGNTLTWEHLDYNFNNGVFANDQGGLALREAFAMCVPRQQIVETLIQPINPEAEVMNAREVFPFHTDGAGYYDYEEVVSAAYDGQYDEVDIEGATAAIEESGIETPIDVRIGYSSPNQRRSEEVAAIKASCDQAGFNITDAGSEDFFNPGGTQEQGDYEVALFAWAGSGQIASGRNIYATGQPQNYTGYSNETVDEAWNTLVSTVDPEVHAEQVKIIEEELWDSLFGIPLFAHPGVIAYDSTLENVRNTTTQDGVTWNAEQWMYAE